MKPVIGVLALQGDVAEHVGMLARLGAVVTLVKHPEALADVDGLVIPGGESTTVARLTAEGKDGMLAAIREHAQSGIPIYGTCMGMVFLAREIEGSQQGRLALMDICVRRNAFGSQGASFERLVEVPALGGKPVHMVFIRAPIILEAGPAVQVMASVPEGIVMARQGNLLVTAFHPELTDDTRVHGYFPAMVREIVDRKQEPAVSSLYQNSRQFAQVFGR
jgi:pyridoxal 5'-phosphate synthase pdxT subunit